MLAAGGGSLNYNTGTIHEAVTSERDDLSQIVDQVLSTMEQDGGEQELANAETGIQASQVDANNR